MFARKLMHLMAAVVVGLVGFGVVLADDGPPMPPAEPIVPPVAVSPPLATKDAAARLKAQAKALAGTAAKGERVILIQAMCMDVPAGFCEEVGLEEKQTAWSLSSREARMFNALIRAQKGKGAITIVSEPQLVLQDNQTGFAQIGQDFPYVASAAVKGKDGKIIEEAKISYQPVGVTLKATPRISADGKSLELHLDSTVTDASTVQIIGGDGTTTPGPAFSFQNTRINVLLPDPGSFVFRAGRTSKDLERIWVVTTHIVKGNATILSGTKRPSAAPKHPLPVLPPAPILPAVAAPAAGLVPVPAVLVQPGIVMPKPLTPMTLPSPPRP